MPNEFFIMLSQSRYEAENPAPGPAWLYPEMPTPKKGEIVLRCVPVEPPPRWVIETPRGVLGAGGQTLFFRRAEEAIEAVSRLPDGLMPTVREEEEGD